MKDSSIWVPVKVMAGHPSTEGKAALEYFMQRWKESGHGIPFNGEGDIPASNDPRRLCTIDTDKISHCVTDIDMNTYDAAKQTVMAQIRFCGPKRDEVAEKYIENTLRFATRVVHGPDEVTKKPVDRIVTIDCIQEPNDAIKKSKGKKK